MNFDFSQTYLYKLHSMMNLMDRVFDQTLRGHANISLSQFTLLLSVAQHGTVSGRRVAKFLQLTPGAISRQVEVARQNGWVKVAIDPNDRRGQQLTITPGGRHKIQTGIAALEQSVFSIFDDHNRQTNLMDHIDQLIKTMTNLPQSSTGK